MSASIEPKEKFFVNPSLGDSVQDSPALHDWRIIAAFVVIAIIAFAIRLWG